MEQKTEREMFPFLNGKDIATYPDGVELDILEVRDKRQGDGFYIDVHADNDANYTVTANFVFVSMLLKKLADEKFDKPAGSPIHIRVYPYKKTTKDGEVFYLSLNKQKDSEKPSFNKSAQKTGGFQRK